MNAYNVKGSIVAACSILEAVATWAEYFDRPYNAAGDVKQVSLETPVAVEDGGDVVEWKKVQGMMTNEPSVIVPNQEP